jgi:cell division transport system permease protein
VPGRLDYYFRETLTGVRRNGSMTFAAISTAFVSLFLLGGALLIQRQASLAIDDLTANVQVTVFLTDPVNPDTVAHLTDKLTGLQAVESVHFEDKSEACARFIVLFADQPALVNNVDCRKDPSILPASLRVKLAIPDRYPDVPAALGCETTADGKQQCAEPGIEKVVDNRSVYDTLFLVIDFFRFGVGSIALLTLVSSALLIANTIRIGLFARRREITIMKLVGATNWRIRVPFLIEGVIQGLIGAALAVVALFTLKVVFVDNRAKDLIHFIRWITDQDVFAVIPWLALTGVAVAVIASIIAMRRFLDV